MDFNTLLSSYEDVACIKDGCGKQVGIRHKEFPKVSFCSLECFKDSPTQQAFPVCSETGDESNQHQAKMHEIALSGALHALNIYSKLMPLSIAHQCCGGREDFPALQIPSTCGSIDIDKLVSLEDFNAPDTVDNPVSLGKAASTIVDNAVSLTKVANNITVGKTGAVKEVAVANTVDIDNAVPLTKVANITVGNAGAVKEVDNTTVFSQVANTLDILLDSKIGHAVSIGKTAVAGSLENDPTTIDDDSVGSRIKSLKRSRIGQPPSPVLAPVSVPAPVLAPATRPSLPNIILKYRYITSHPAPAALKSYGTFYDIGIDEIGPNQEVLRTHANSLTDIYFQTRKMQDLVADLQVDIQRILGQGKIGKLVADNARVGDLCLAPFEDEFYRGIITKVEHRHLTVFFMDYGNEEVMRKEEKFYKLPDLLAKCPRLANHGQWDYALAREIPRDQLLNMVNDESLKTAVIQKITDGQYLIRIGENKPTVRLIPKPDVVMFPDLVEIHTLDQDIFHA